MNRLSKLVAVAFALAMCACSEEKIALDSSSGIEEGLPATISVRIQVPAAQKMSISRTAEDVESEISQLLMIMYSNQSDRKEVIDLTGKIAISGGTADQGQRFYSTTADIPTTSGNYRVYFIANWESAFAGVTRTQLENYTEEQLKSLVINNNNATQLVGQYRLPMSFYSDGIDIYPDQNGSPDSRNQLGQMTDGHSSIQLRRVTSRINFTFESGTGVTFTPTNITLYNLPKQAPMFDAQNFNVTGVHTTPPGSFTLPDNASFNSETEPVINSAFSFLMLESTPALVNGLTSWKQREAWDENADNADPATRVFSNAPANSPFVVVTGSYSGPEGSGTARYFIHLGNFGSSSGNKTNTDRYGNVSSYGNFLVNRNEEQNYKITVTGINSIKAEVGIESGSEDNPAVEGSMVLLDDTKITTVDSHYEQVMVRIPQNYFSSDSEPSIMITSPATQFVTNLYIIGSDGYYSATVDDAGNPVKGSLLAENDIDCHWIQFQKPTQDNITSKTFPLYAGLNDNGTPKTGLGYIKDLVANPDTYATLYDGNYYTVAWIDENIYQEKDFNSFVGEDIPNRIFVFRPNPIRRSPDKQSTVVEHYAFAIEQMPLFSPLSGDFTNPFGFESVEEMAEPVFTSLTATGFTANTGSATIANGNHITKSGLEWSGTRIEENSSATALTGQRNTVRRINTITDLNRTPLTDYGYFFDETTNKYTLKSSSITNTLNAVKSRNRDLDGSGSLDDDEIRWYMPTFTQYSIYWLSRQYVSTSRRLFPLKDRTGINDVNIPRYFCTGRSAYGVFWQDQGASSPESDLHGGAITGSNRWFQPKQCVRFARNLGKSATAYSDPCSRLTFEHNTTEHYLRLNPTTFTRNYTITSPYERMYQNGADNQIPSGLEYMPHVLQISNPNNEVINYNNNDAGSTTGVIEAVRKAYRDAINDQTADPFAEGWRIPNQNELLLLSINNVFQEYVEQRGQDINGTTISGVFNIIGFTWLSQADDTRIFRIEINPDKNAPIATWGFVSNAPYVILVRDYVPTANASNDSRFTGGGGSAIR